MGILDVVSGFCILDLLKLGGEGVWEECGEKDFFLSGLLFLVNGEELLNLGFFFGFVFCNYKYLLDEGFFFFLIIKIDMYEVFLVKFVIF